MVVSITKMMTNKSLFSFEENIMKWEIALVLKNNEDILEGNQFRSYKFTLEIWYKWKKVEKYKFKKKKKLKPYIKMDKEIWNLMTLKLKNTNFINIKALFR